jgi:cytochrome c biogenesis protein
VVFLPQDGNFSSAGAIKAPDARPERLAFEGFFLPTAILDAQGPRSVFPDALNPALFVNAWYGPPKVETGVPENVYSLDTRGLTRFTAADGTPLRIALQTGDGVKLPDGKGSIQLDGWTRWVKLQVGATPGVPICLAAIGLAVAGLCLSLFIRPRRVWIRVRTPGPGPSVVEVGGLDRADARAGLAEDVAELAAGEGRGQGRQRIRGVGDGTWSTTQTRAGDVGRGLRAGHGGPCVEWAAADALPPTIRRRLPMGSPPPIPAAEANAPRCRGHASADCRSRE